MPWNKGRLPGARPPLRPKHVWSIRSKLQLENRTRELAMFNVAIDSKLRASDIVRLKVDDVAPYGQAAAHATIRQKKTSSPVKFELTEPTREAVEAYIKAFDRQPGQYLFRGCRGRDHMSTRTYVRHVRRWIAGIGLNAQFFGTHSLRRTKATLIHRRTGNLRAVQLLLRHNKIESTVVDDALDLAEHADI